MVRLFFILFFIFIYSNLKGQIYFSEVANMPEPVSNNAIVEGWKGDTCFAFSFGGIDTTKLWSGIHLRSFRYNLVTDVWDTIPSLPDTLGKIAAGASWVDSIIYIIGGYHVYSNGNEASSDKVHRYDPRTNTYLSDGAPIPVPIDDHVQAVWNDSLIYVITGWSNTGNVPDVQIYDPANDQWLVGTPVPNNSYQVFGASGTIMGDSIYYHGGALYGFNFPAQSTLRIGHINPANPTQITWYDRNSPFLGYRSACFNPFDFTQEVLWLGGSSTTYNYDGIAYNGSGGVQPSNLSISYTNYNDTLDTYPLLGGTNIPMDLRGIAKIDGPWITGVGLIAGGMDSNQTVSDKTYIVDFIITENEEYNKNNISFKIFPNPTENLINLQFESLKNRTIQLIDILGKEILVLKSSKSFEQIDVSSYPKGIYFLKVETDTDSQTQKIIIQ